MVEGPTRSWEFVSSPTGGLTVDSRYSIVVIDQFGVGCTGSCKNIYINGYLVSCHFVLFVVSISPLHYRIRNSVCACEFLSLSHSILSYAYPLTHVYILDNWPMSPGSI